MQLPQDKLDLILRRHDEINGRLAANPDATTIVALSRELAGLESVTAAIREYRSQATELDGLAAMLDDAGLDAEMRDLAEEERRTGETRLEDAVAHAAGRAAAEGRGRREERDPRDPRRHRRRRGGAVRRRSVPHVPALRGDAPLEGRDRLHLRGHRRRLQGDHRRDRGRRRVRQAEVRERRPPRAARAGHRDAGAYPHLGRHRRRAAAGRGGRRRRQRGGPEDRHDAGAGRPAASTSTRRNRRSASRICRPTR